MDKATSSNWPRWMVLALLLPLGTFFATAGVMSIPPNTRGIDIVEGHDLFRTHCGSCHFTEVGFPAHNGPNLNDIGRIGSQRRPNMSAPQYVLQSILDPSAFVSPSSRPGMPRNVATELAPEQLRNIVGFLAGRGAYADYDEVAALEIPDRRTPETEHTQVRLQDMLLAEQTLQGKAGCLKCHSRHHVPESKVYAPGIFNVGLTDKLLLRESVVDPYKEIKPNYYSVNIELTNGQVKTGRLLTRTDDMVVLCTWDDKGELALEEISLTDVEEDDGRLLVEESKVSIMPTGFDKLLTKDELEAVLILIHQLN